MVLGHAIEIPTRFCVFVHVHCTYTTTNDASYTNAFRMFSSKLQNSSDCPMLGGKLLWAKGQTKNQQGDAIRSFLMNMVMPQLYDWSDDLPGHAGGIVKN